MTSAFRDIGKRTELALLAAVLILAGLLRMGWPGLTEFKADEAHMMELALDMVEGKGFPLRGMGSSVGLPNFPMSVWVYALPLILWKHVYSATLFTGLLNTLAVLGCWWFVRRYWGSTAALAAALMYAVSPWGMIFSRKIWAQNLLPVFVMIWAISAALAFVEKRPRFILPHLLSLVIAVQIHLAAVALAAATAIVILVFRQRVDWRWALLGVGIAVVTVLPFAYYLTSAGLGLRDVLHVTQDLEGGADLKSFRYAWMISLGREIHSLAGPDAFQDYLATVPDISAVHWLWGVLILSGLGWLGWQAWKQRGDRAAEAGLVVVVWGLMQPLFFVWHSTPVFIHYLIPTYPAQYIAAGVIFAAVIRSWRATRVGRYLKLHWAGWTILGLSAAAQVWVSVGLLAFVGTHATPGAFGTPLKMQLQAAELAQTMMAEESAAEVLIAGPGESTEFDGFAAVNSILLRSVPHRLVDVNRSAVFPTTPAVVLLSHPPGEQAERYLTSAVGTELVALRPGEGTVQVLALPEKVAPKPEFEFPYLVMLANGVTLLGYDAPVLKENVTVTWQVYWRPGAPSEVDYHFFNHLVDGGGQLVSQADAAAFSSQQWRPGDIITSRFVLPWPASTEGPLTMRTGMYTYPALENVPLIDVAGNPSADAVEVSLP